MGVERDLSKAKLREQARSIRRDRLAKDPLVSNTALCAGLASFLQQWYEQQQGQATPPWTLAFVAMPGEPSLAELVADTSMAGVTRFATTRTPAKSMDLTIHPMDSVFERHRYGFDQPIEGSDVVADADVCAVLVPGLVFDEQGGRLGFGAGYYDRLLERLMRGREPGALAIVGISDGFGLTDGPTIGSVPMQAHDIPMTHLATSAGVRATGVN